ncbi:Hypothetical predicted protein [Paramuricea clavata]|uniref:Uncharacterized protein n=1 Tax=Paramuricea clavata TaxID=317549 RepID=A0A7D9LLN7_PARCT|nr:Hypothetical predicted protein [Paramuricea clavata]
MGKPDSEISDLEKKRIMRNCRKKRRRQQRAINKRTASEAVLARKVNDGLMEQKALAEKYHDKWRKLCREAKDLRRKIPIQSHSRKVNYFQRQSPAAIVKSTLSTIQKYY